MDNSLAATWRDICGTIWTSRHAERIFEEISYTVGPRPPGSHSVQQARAYVTRELEELGVTDVHEEAVPIFAGSADTSS